MKETLKIPVINMDENEVELEFVYEDNVVSVFFEGVEICGMDYNGNFVFFLQRALKNWGFASETNGSE